MSPQSVDTGGSRALSAFITLLLIPLDMDGTALSASAFIFMFILEEVDGNDALLVNSSLLSTTEMSVDLGSVIPRIE